MQSHSARCVAKKENCLFFLVLFSVKDTTHIVKGTEQKKKTEIIDSLKPTNGDIFHRVRMADSCFTMHTYVN